MYFTKRLCEWDADWCLQSDVYDRFSSLQDDTWFSMMAYFRKIPIFLPGCSSGCANPHVGPRQGDGLSDPRPNGHPRHKPPTSKTRECEDAILANKTVVLDPLYKGGPTRYQLRFFDVPPAGG